MMRLAMTATSRIETLNDLQRTAIIAAFARRFTMAAKILGDDKHVRVDVFANGADSTTSYWDDSQNYIKINLLNPPHGGTLVDELIQNRAKLYHELAHKFYSGSNAPRAKIARDLQAKSKYREASSFLSISNMLDDGRIERLMRIDYMGVGEYFDIWVDLFRQKATANPKSELTDLLYRVRSGKYVNERSAKFFAKYEKRIEEAVTTKKPKIVLDVTLELMTLWPTPPEVPADPNNHNPPPGKPPKNLPTIDPAAYAYAERKADHFASTHQNVSRSKLTRVFAAEYHIAKKTLGGDEPGG